MLASISFALARTIKPFKSSLEINETLHVFGNRSDLVDRPLNDRFSLPNSCYHLNH